MENKIMRIDTDLTLALEAIKNNQTFVGRVGQNNNAADDYFIFIQIVGKKYEVGTYTNTANEQLRLSFYTLSDVKGFMHDYFSDFKSDIKSFYILESKEKNLIQYRKLLAEKIIELEESYESTVPNI